MSEFDLQVQISDLLTSYIQYFKNILSAKLSLVESLCIDNQSLQNNPQFWLSKFGNRTFGSSWNVDPFIVNISVESGSIIQRFYLRIQQYLEYRLGSLLAFNDASFNLQIQQFQKQLQRTVKAYHTNIDTSTTLGTMFQQINKLESHFIFQLLDILTKRKSLLTRGLMDADSLEEVKKFISNKICKEQNVGFKEFNKVREITIRREQSLSLPKKIISKIKENGKPKLWDRKKKNNKIQLPSPYLSIGLAVVPNQKRKQDKGLWKEKDTARSDSGQDLVKYLQQVGKDKYNRVYALLQVQQYPQSINRDVLFQQLQQKNIKNKMLIDDYMKRYNRKMRRESRRQQSEQIVKSASKSLKSTVKSQESGMFHSKMESKESHVSSNKSNVDSNRRIQMLELPLIASRQNRRITVQK